jgi:hypothetical protein
MFYSVRNLDHDFRCVCVKGFKVTVVTSSFLGINISELSEHVIGKF